MAKAMRATVGLKRRFDVEDDTDDEDFDPFVEVANKRSRREKIDLLKDDGAARKNLVAESKSVEENPVGKALHKCHEVNVAMRAALISSTMATTANTAASKEKKLVLKPALHAACGIPPGDDTRDIKPYQISGVNFLLLMNRLSVGGAILADEMGLGKTVQAIAFLAALKHIHNIPGPHLVVAPASVLENWKREITKWCPSFSVVLYHGNKRAPLCSNLMPVAESGGLAPFNVMITSYSLFERQSAQMKEDRKFLKMWDWNCVVMDEGHLLKDSSSYRCKRLQDIACKAKQRIMLTGTPVQNDLKELWSLLSFIMPDTFDTSEGDLDAYLGTRNNGMQDQSLITKIQELLKPFVFRRTKAEVLWQLVSKTQQVVHVNMPDDQARAYEEALSQCRAIAVSGTNCSRATDDAEHMNIHKSFSGKEISNIFTHLRKLGNHPLLARQIYTDEIVKQLAIRFHCLGVFGNGATEKRVQEHLLSCSDFALHKLCCDFGGIPGGQGKLDDALALSSAKCQHLAKLLPELKKDGHRCLIFSQWTAILDILEWVLHVLGFQFVRLDGNTDVAQRQTLVDEFNNNPNIFIFLISTRAGGQGLNLTGADTVIIHDVDFNPQVDRQAEDRCHRIGQTKPVTIYRLVTQGTVDESILKIAQEKLVLDAAVLQKQSGSEAQQNQNQREILTMGKILSQQIRRQ